MWLEKSPLPLCFEAFYWKEFFLLHKGICGHFVLLRHVNALNLHHFFTSSKAQAPANFIGLPRRLSRNNNSPCFCFPCCHAFVTNFCHSLLQESNATCADDKAGDVTRDSKASSFIACRPVLYSECHFASICLGSSVFFLLRNFLI